MAFFANQPNSLRFTVTSQCSLVTSVPLGRRRRCAMRGEWLRRNLFVSEWLRCYVVWLCSHAHLEFSKCLRVPFIVFLDVVHGARIANKDPVDRISSPLVSARQSLQNIICSKTPHDRVSDPRARTTLVLVWWSCVHSLVHCVFTRTHDARLPSWCWTFPERQRWRTVLVFANQLQALPFWRDHQCKWSV